MPESTQDAGRLEREVRSAEKDATREEAAQLCQGPQELLWREPSWRPQGNPSQQGPPRDDIQEPLTPRGEAD
jgi:hypothetical protein